MPQTTPYTPVFDWAIVELFGHNRIVGILGEQQIGGETFIRVDVPSVNGSAGFTKLYGKGAIYAITPTTEQLAKAAIEAMQPVPVSLYDLKLSLPSGNRMHYADGFGDEDDEEDD